MSVTYQINDDIAEIIIIGNCAQDELLSGFNSLLSDQGLSMATHLLINVGESETLPSSDAIEQIAYIIGTAIGRFSGRVSVFVAHKVRYGIARQLSVYLESFDLVSRPFYDLQSAVDWLRETVQN